MATKPPTRNIFKDLQRWCLYWAPNAVWTSCEVVLTDCASILRLLKSDVFLTVRSSNYESNYNYSTFSTTGFSLIFTPTWKPSHVYCVCVLPFHSLFQFTIYHLDIYTKMQNPAMWRWFSKWDKQFDTYHIYVNLFKGNGQSFSKMIFPWDLPFIRDFPIKTC